MFFLYTTDSNKPQKFAIKAELKEYIEIRHTESGGFDWICEIKDDKGNSYGCSWNLEIEKIQRKWTIERNKAKRLQIRFKRKSFGRGIVDRKVKGEIKCHY